MASTMPGHHYSGKNPIPNIQKFVESLDRDKKRRDEEIEKRSNAQQDEVKPHYESEHPSKPGTEKIVTDPTTGGEVKIGNVDQDFMKAVRDPQLSVPNANLQGTEVPIKSDARQPYPEYKKAQDVTAPPEPAPGATSDVPIHGEKTNILFHPTPTVSFEPMASTLEKRAAVLCICVLVGIIVLGKMFGARMIGLIPTGLFISTGIWLWMKEVIRSAKTVEWEQEKKRGETATANLLPESVEWMNTLLGIIWGLINPDMFAGIADTLEDVMQASLPGVIENVRVAEINQGSNPLRILSLRSLPDSHVKELKDSIHEANLKNKDPEEAAADEIAGDFYNLEVSLAYHADPSGRGVSSKARNVHMQLVFYLGIKGLFGVPLPIWVELQGLVATARIRLQMTQEPPFLKALTFTLMGVPKVEAGCVPMLETGVNVLNLPVISKFVNMAIAAASSMYVAPKSMSLDMAKILKGDDVTKDVEALGVLWIRIHRGVDLSKQDRRGSKYGGSDPYITITFSKFGKPMYSTRVITDELNPIWEETAAILVTPDYIKADEQLSIELWDSDKTSADDVVGKIQLSMQKLIQHPGKMYPHVSSLQGMDKDKSMPGHLHWEVGFFGKPKFRPALRTDGKDDNLPTALKDNPKLQDNKGSLDNAEEDAVAHTPPDPLWPSGICNIIVHEIVGLELVNIKGTTGKRKGREFEPAVEAGEIKEEAGKSLPSAYCTILFNDQLFYRTRSKVVSSNPIFNAGTERFIRDWRSAIITVTVRDQRMREHDPILGVVPLRLSDVLKTSSQVTRWYPIGGGIGHGRVRLSLLFRSVETRLPQNLLGWDVGTFEFMSDRILAIKYNKTASLKMRTGGSSGKISKTQCQKLGEGDGVYFDLDKKDGKNNVRLPVKYRYRSPVVFELHTGSRSVDAYAVIWLQHLTDNEDAAINIPIWRTKQGHRITQNYVTEQNYKELPGLDDLEEVGRLQFRCRFKAGTDDSHAKFVTDNDSRETQETWEACHGEGIRTNKVQMGIPEQLQKAHDESLTQGRDILKQADPEEKKKWLSKDGTDWSGAFGEDPAKYIDNNAPRKYEANGHAKRDPDNPSSDEDDDSDDGTESSSDLGVQDYNTSSANNMNGGTENGAVKSLKHGAKQSGPMGEYKDYKENEKAMHRKHRGLMQWKPMRNAQFAKDEMKFGLKKMKSKLGHKGREPDVETEAA